MSVNKFGDPVWEWRPQLPDDSQAGIGDVLAVTRFGIEWVVPPDGLPDLTNAKPGEVLGINPNGDLEWVSRMGTTYRGSAVGQGPPGGTNFEAGDLFINTSSDHASWIWSGTAWEQLSTPDTMPAHPSSEAGKVLRVTSTGTLEWATVTAGGSSSFKAPVANAAALPPTGNAAGDVRITLDDGHMHVWDGGSWTNIGPSSGSGVPAASVTNNGQALLVVGGVPTWAQLPNELPAALGTAGQVLTVNTGATGVQWDDVPGYDDTAVRGLITANAADITTATGERSALAARVTKNETDIAAIPAPYNPAPLTARVTAAEAAITAEQTARANADTSIDARVTKNAADIAALPAPFDPTALTGRVTAAEGAITAEQTARSNADSALAARVTQNETDIAAIPAPYNDATLVARVAAEEAARAAADTALDTRVTAAETAAATEATTRANADTALDTRVTALEANPPGTGGGTFDPTALQTQITKNANDIAALPAPFNPAPLTARVTAAESAVAAATAAAAKNAADIAALPAPFDPTTLTARVTATESATATNTAAIAALPAPYDPTALAARVTAAEGAISTEATDRAAAVSAEETARANADTALDTRVTALENAPSTGGHWSGSRVAYDAIANKDANTVYFITS